MDIIAALGGTAWTVFFFVIALSIIVFVHEYGHYIVGRWSGIHSEVFSVGFGPVLWSRRDRRGTKWQIAAIPFGGYVKFLGDADATSVRAGDSSGLTAAERRHTMQGAPLWARSATVAAGPVANFILAFLILVGMFLVLGVPSETPTVGAVRALPYAEQSLREGDVILAMDGQETPDQRAYLDALPKLERKPAIEYRVLRDGQELTVTGPHPNAPVIGDVLVRSAALDAGLQPGDVILKVDGQDVHVFSQIREIVLASEGRPVRMTVWRDGRTFDVSLTPRVRSAPDESGNYVDVYQIGLAPGFVFEPATRRPGLIEAVEISASNLWRMATTTFHVLGRIITGAISNCNFSGAIGMAEAVGDAARLGPESLIGIVAALSFGVGLLNLFPIPVLDGGHLVFHLYEAVTRRKPSDRALHVLTTIGLTFVIAVMLFALSRDLVCV
ncbi:MAG: RIP metalloprotease RseP [Tabrizicola sp.]